MKFRLEGDSSTWGARARLAKAVGIQASFLSQVLKGSADLSLDQGYSCSSFWNLSSLERDYFLELINYSRAGSKGLRETILGRLEQMRLASEDLGSRFSDRNLNTESSIYYSSWIPVAIHMLLTIPRFRGVKEIASRLSLREPSVRGILKELESIGLVSKDKGGDWMVKEKTLHLPRSSPLSAQNNLNWRLKGSEANKLDADTGVFYTGVCTMSAKDFQSLKEKVLELITESRELAKASEEEELFCFNVDLFSP